MTNYEAIKQMSIEELAFFLCVVENNDLNSIPNINIEDVNYFLEYLNKDGNGLVEYVRELLNKVKSTS